MDKETFYKLTGEIIRHYRRKKDLPQKYIASALGISQPTYSRIEAGTTKYDAYLLRQISQILMLTSEETAELLLTKPNPRLVEVLQRNMTLRHKI